MATLYGSGSGAGGRVLGSRGSGAAGQNIGYFGRGRSGYGTSTLARRLARRNAGRPSGLSGQYQSAMDEAKAANESRYQEILGGYRNRQQQAEQLLEGVGNQQRADLSKQFSDAATRQRQSLRARGLAGTSIMPSVEAGIAREQSDASARLEESLKRERLGYQTGLSADTLGFMERREDVGPDLNQLAQLAEMQGSASYGKGYGSKLRRGAAGTYGIGAYGSSLRPVQRYSSYKAPARAASAVPQSDISPRGYPVTEYGMMRTKSYM